MSFMSLLTYEEAVTVFESLLTGADVPAETMETSPVTSGVVLFEVDKEEQGLDEEGLETAAIGC